jgi:AcrR family transcriptional regulator
METITENQKSAGRPRSSEADQAILETTIRLLMEQGYDAMSMEGVATAAGVGKTTIYRRYPGKRELVVAAVSSLASTVELPPDSGDTRAELYKIMHDTYEIIESRGLFSLLGTLLAKEREDPMLLDLFRKLVIGPRIAVISTVVRRGVERGTVRTDVDLSTVVQMLAGSMFAHHVIGGAPDDHWFSGMIDTLWSGIRNMNSSK